MKVVDSCFHCPDRHPICHDSCPKYAEYKRQLKEQRAYTEAKHAAERIGKNAFNQEFWMGGKKAMRVSSIIEGRDVGMKAVLLSIRPEWCKKIANLRKTVEIRKTAPNLEVPFKCYIYCTKAPKKLITIFRDGEESYDGEIYHGKTKFITWDDIGVSDDIDSAMQMIIGEFVCDDIRRIGPEYCAVKEDIESAISGSCLTVPQVKDYAGWKPGRSYADLKDLYGWHISDLKIYDRPRPLSDFTRLRATKFGYEPVEIRRPPQSWFYVEDGR